MKACAHGGRHRHVDAPGGGEDRRGPRHRVPHIPNLAAAWGELTDDEYMTYFTDVCGSSRLELPPLQPAAPQEGAGDQGLQEAAGRRPKPRRHQVHGSGPGGVRHAGEGDGDTALPGRQQLSLRLPARRVLPPRIIRAHDAEEDAGVLQVRRRGRLRETFSAYRPGSWPPPTTSSALSGTAR